jgi:uncharacterized protein YqiB (DUF1249 family)
MIEVKYKLCKRATLTNSNKPIYYLAITNKEEVIDNLKLFPVSIQLVETICYILHIDILVKWEKVSSFNRNKTNIKLYKDLYFVEVLSMLNMFYELRDGDFSKVSNTINKEELIGLIQLIIAKWHDWS